MSETVFDVAIVGAGPAGSTCAYYLAQQGHAVLLLEKKAFPRDKLCGDAVCSGAFVHLRAMGVMQELEAEGKGHWAKVGGMVSPGGDTYVGDSTTSSTNALPLVMAVKRAILDEKMARAAVRAGATLREGHRVAAVTLDAGRGHWTVEADVAGDGGGRRVSVKARLLVLADGALSRLATRLGLLRAAPDGICSRSYIQAGTHRFDADGVVFYTHRLVPGYAALFKEAGGDVNYCCYIIPGGRATVEDLHLLHHDLLDNHPYVKRAVGPDAVMEKMRGAPLRLGGIPRSVDDQLLVVGDAAGMIDPLTGEGIHLAIEGGHLAAITCAEALAAGDLSARFLERYHQRWMKSFGRDFALSRQLVKFYVRYPLFLDAYVGLARKKGPEFLAEWAKVMTGAEPKTHFFRPDLLLPLVAETGKVWARNTFFNRQPPPNMRTAA